MFMKPGFRLVIKMNAVEAFNFAMTKKCKRIFGKWSTVVEFQIVDEKILFIKTKNISKYKYLIFIS